MNTKTILAIILGACFIQAPVWSMESPAMTNAQLKTQLLIAIRNNDAEGVQSLVDRYGKDRANRVLAPTGRKVDPFLQITPPRSVPTQPVAPRPPAITTFAEIQRLNNEALSIFQQLSSNIILASLTPQQKLDLVQGWSDTISNLITAIGGSRPR